MKLFITYCFTFLCLFFITPLQAQCYQRIALVGDCSIRIIPKTVVNKPKRKARYKKPFRGIQFQRKGNLISIRAIDISKDKYLCNLDIKNDPMSLIRYTRDYYGPIDSNCIAFDTLAIGQLNQQYKFVDLLQIDKFYNNYFYCSENLLNYFCLKERLLVVDKYVYIFSVQAIQNCQSKDKGIALTKKAVRVDFNRLVRSIKIHKPK